MKPSSTASGRIRPPVSREHLRELLEGQPRVELSNWPTPLEPMSNLSRYLSSARIYMKREDLTGLGLGGNKIRALEYRMARAIDQECDCVVAALDVQSNAARQLTAAGNRLGLETFLVLQGSGALTAKGNALIDLVLGAHVRLVSAEGASELDKSLQELVHELRTQGRRPYVMNTDPAFELASAFAAMRCALECRDQMDERGESIDYLYVSSRGKGQSGFVLASLALQDNVSVIGIAAARGGGVQERATTIANRAAEVLGLDLQCTEADIENYEDFAGGGYGVPSAAALSAILLVARTEGILLDPVYTGKAMAGLMEHVRSARLPANASVLFIHTGGTPALFQHAEAVLDHAEHSPLRGQ